MMHTVSRRDDMLYTKLNGCLPLTTKHIKSQRVIYVFVDIAKESLVKFRFPRLRGQTRRSCSRAWWRPREESKAEHGTAEYMASHNWMRANGSDISNGTLIVLSSLTVAYSSRCWTKKNEFCYKTANSSLASTMTCLIVMPSVHFMLIMHNYFICAYSKIAMHAYGMTLHTNMLHVNDLLI